MPTPILNLPAKYVNGLQITNDATTPNTLLDIAVGQCRDSSNTYDMVADTALVINAAATGVNGIDTGTFAASKVYAVYLISDPISSNDTAAMISLSLTGPVMPFGYSAYRLIGYWTTDASAHFLLGYVAQVGNSQSRSFFFDAPQATAITAGASTSYAAIDLSAIVPTVSKTPVYVFVAHTPNAASATVKLQPTGGTGDAITITGQVAAVVINAHVKMMSLIASSKPEISYKQSSGSSACAISILGYDYSL